MNLTLSYVKRFSLFLLVVIAGNYLSTLKVFQLDLTEDQRHTLHRETVKWIKAQEENVLAEVLFAGDFPPGYKRLQEATIDFLKKCRNLNPSIRYIVKDPMEGQEEAVNERISAFSKMGMVPLPVRFESGTEFIVKQAFPYVVITKGAKRVIITLTEGMIAGPYNEEKLNEAVANIEYKFTNAFQKLMQEERRKIAFHTGKGELSRQKTFRLEQELSKFYHIGRFSLDTVQLINPAIDLIIFASPVEAFSERELFAIDRYIMEGGKIIWLLNPVMISMDSIAKHDPYVPLPLELGLENLFFKYGVRMNTDLVLDMESAQIPLVTGMIGGEPQIDLYPWYFYPLVRGSRENPINAGVEPLLMRFPSSIDTVRTDGQILKDIVLATSNRSRIQTLPSQVSLEMVRFPVSEDRFIQRQVPVAVLTEGFFPSLFANRLTPYYTQMLMDYGLEAKSIGDYAIQLFVSDARLIISDLNPATGELLPIGYHRDERKTFPGNKEWILNAVEYMMGNGPVLHLKNKKVSLRLFNAERLQAERKWWQWFNTVFPLVFLTIGGVIYQWVRKKRYSQPIKMNRSKKESFS
ncbi:MAG TPA: gliding motility-associated ABC transporter substrate-binding protein GldG [Saprospiraceae bacterium]|nr:gliding motility-associated ABC transporter substrate-binding protein GldG [Saprospiraceae bacterium]